MIITIIIYVPAIAKLHQYYVRVADVEEDEEVEGHRTELKLQAQVSGDMAEEVLQSKHFSDNPDFLNHKRKCDEAPETKKTKEEGGTSLPKTRKTKAEGGESLPEKNETKTKAIHMQPEDLKNPRDQAECFAASLSSELGKGKEMITKLFAHKIGSDISGKIEAAATEVETHYVTLTQYISDQEEDRSKYLPVMTKAKTEYSKLKQNIKIGNAMIRAAVPASKKATSKRSPK